MNDATSVFLSAYEQGDSAVLYENMKLLYITMYSYALGDYIAGRDTNEDYAFSCFKKICELSNRKDVIFVRGASYSHSICFCDGEGRLIDINTKEVVFATKLEPVVDFSDLVRTLIPINLRVGDKFVDAQGNNLIRGVVFGESFEPLECWIEQSIVDELGLSIPLEKLSGESYYAYGLGEKRAYAKILRRNEE